MRLTLTILLFIAHKLHATNYYFANTGNDATGNGSQATPYQTLSKLRTFIGSLSASDSVLFKRGETFYGYFTVSSGVKIGAYGTGTKPVISAFNSAQPTFSQSGNVYTATISDAVAYPVVMLVNGVVRGKARTPNSGWRNSTVAIHQSYLWLRGDVPDSPNLTGAEIVVRTQDYITDTKVITSHPSDTLKYRPLTYEASRVQYFLQNHSSFLDQGGEWTFDSTTKTLSVYWSGSTPNVQYSTRDTLITVTGNNASFSDITFEGANNIAIYANTITGLTITNCTFNYIGGNNVGPAYLDGIQGAAIMLRSASNVTLQNDSLLNCLNDGVYSLTSNNTNVLNCYIKNVAMIDGLAGSSNGAGMALYLNGATDTVSKNIIDSVGYIPVYSYGAGHLVKNNVIWYYNAKKDDGAGIYTYAPRTATPASQFIGNIIIGGIGLGGTTAGIYLDGNSNNVTVQGNSIINGGLQGIMLNYPDHISILDNIISDSLGIPLYKTNQGAANNFTIKRNVFYQRKATNPVQFWQANTLSGTNVIDSNYNLRPTDETDFIWSVNSSNKYTQSGWNTLTGREANSNGSPSARLSNYAIHVYNPTATDSSVSLGGYYTDAAGTVYPGSFTLPAFESRILFPITTPVIQRINKKYFSKFKRVRQA